MLANDNHQISVSDAVANATLNVNSLNELGRGVALAVAGSIPFDRFNIGRIDQSRMLFYDEFVTGKNVAGRAAGHQRTLDGSVVEAAIQAGPGFYFGNSDSNCWLERFPRFGPVFESGIRAMLAAPLRYQERVVATLVFASCDARAYNQQTLESAATVSEVIASSTIFHTLFCTGR